MNITSIPAFDPDSPDVDILSAYERIRANKEWAYRYDDVPEDLWPVAEMDKRDEAQAADEAIIETAFPVTTGGALPRLLLGLTKQHPDRWLDRALAEGGVLALVANRGDLDGHAQQLLAAAVDLIRIDWAQALFHAERSTGTYASLFHLNDLVDTEEFRQKEGGGVSQFVADLSVASDQLRDVVTDDFPLRRLIRTLAPDEAAYLRKFEIAAAEGLLDEAAPWLARDTKFLLGATARPSGEI
ncbi:hypothetical protein H5J25_13750 [Sphingomonas aliaeris]|uniref:Uncharacterized protein n=1 Tax=Sphingomonas aliaeris TaxID=2759526 RepID=A0A974S3J8_9SPHN|nr:hypothetical protein [Sphingomonas aliaeris]QQV76509.1 hypothetical protein H5J25_13750 [Sphingomonas aliaeris]